MCFDPNTGKGDPLRLQAALELTPYQVVNILNAPRDKEGKLLSDKPIPYSMTPEERFTWRWARIGLPRWLVAKLWREECAAEEIAQREREKLHYGQ